MARSVQSIILGLAALLGIAASAPAALYEEPRYDAPAGDGTMVIWNHRPGQPAERVDYAVEAHLNNETGLYELSGNWEREGEYKIAFNAVLDPDPQISYGIAVTDFGTPSTFVFNFTTPILWGGGPSVVNSSVVGGLTDFSGNGVSITPAVSLGDPDGDSISELQVASLTGPLTNMGVDAGPVQSFPAGSAGANYSYGAFASGPIAGPGTSPWATLQIDVAFTLSGGSDTAVLTGFASIVPEPSSIVMGILGVAGLAVGARRRRQG